MQRVNGTWLDSSLELNSELFELLISNQMKRITSRIYRLPKSFAYFYSSPMSVDDRSHLEKLLLTLYNEKSNHIVYY